MLCWTRRSASRRHSLVPRSPGSIPNCRKSVRWPSIQPEPQFVGAGLHRRESKACSLAWATVAGLGCSSSANPPPALHPRRSHDIVRDTGIWNFWSTLPMTHLPDGVVCRAYWDPADETACHWADPALEIPWPATDAALSPRDAAAGGLHDLAEEYRRRAGLLTDDPQADD